MRTCFSTREHRRCLTCRELKEPRQCVGVGAKITGGIGCSWPIGAAEHHSLHLARGNLRLCCSGRWRFGLADVYQPGSTVCFPTVMCPVVFSEPPNRRADRDRGSGYVLNFHETCQAKILEPVSFTSNLRTA